MCTSDQPYHNYLPSQTSPCFYRVMSLATLTVPCSLLWILQPSPKGRLFSLVHQDYNSTDGISPYKNLASHLPFHVAIHLWHHQFVCSIYFCCCQETPAFSVCSLFSWYTMFSISSRFLLTVSSVNQLDRDFSGMVKSWIGSWIYKMPEYFRKIQKHIFFARFHNYMYVFVVIWR